MGQTINLLGVTSLGEVALFDTDRSLGGQDGETYHDVGEAAASTTYPARLAVRLLGADDRLEKVFVASNTVALTRRDGWDDQSLAATGELVAGFFRFY